MSRLDVHTAATALDFYRSANASALKFRQFETIPETEKLEQPAEKTPVEVPKLSKVEVKQQAIKTMKRLKTRIAKSLEEQYATVKGQRRGRKSDFKIEFKPAMTMKMRRNTIDMQVPLE